MGGAARKLQAEIDRTLKKVQEGIEEFDQIWVKVSSFYRRCHLLTRRTGLHALHTAAITSHNPAGSHARHLCHRSMKQRIPTRKKS